MRITCLSAIVFSSSFAACSPASSTTGDGGADAGVECVEPTGAGTTHGGSIAQDETWTAAASPHVLPNDTSITAKLTLEPCAAVFIGAGKTVTVSGAGSIVAHGTATKPVGITSKDAKPWASIRAIAGGTLDLRYTGILNGGDPLNTSVELAAALDVRADQAKPPAEVLHADHLLVQDSASNGIFLREGGAFSATSDGVVVTGSKGYPIHTWGNLAGTIPSGVYTGNATDEILITGTGASFDSIARWDVTFHDRGVPYHIGHSTSAGRLDVGSTPKAPVATLTIEPGVVLRFKKGGALHVEYASGVGDPANVASGALVAVGTADKRIVFTSAEAAPAPGDWLGVYFGAIPDPRNKIDFARVAFAGGASSGGSDSCMYPMQPINSAAIRFHGQEPSGAFITNTIISDSASHGVDRGFRSDTKPDFVPTNTFERVAECTQTFPRDISGACPTPVPCPK